jgi:hypothetical protein
MNDSLRQGRVLLAQRFLAHAVRQAIEYDRHRNAGATDHCLTAQNGGVRRDQAEKLRSHVTMIAPVSRRTAVAGLPPSEDHLDAGPRHLGRTATRSVLVAECGPQKDAKKTSEDAKRREFGDTGRDGVTPINIENVTLNRENIGRAGRTSVQD